MTNLWLSLCNNFTTNLLNDLTMKTQELNYQAITPPSLPALFWIKGGFYFKQV